jgi:hypothetical protein
MNIINFYILLVEEEFSSVDVHAEVLLLQEFIEFTEMDAVFAAETSVHELVVLYALDHLCPLWIF